MQAFGGGVNNILIHTGQSALYEAQGIIEETLVHEASHTSLDSDHANAAGCAGMIGRALALFDLISLSLTIACGPRPVVLGLAMEKLAYQSPRIGEPLTTAEFTTIDLVARTEIAKAFAGYDVTVSADRNARYKVAVLPTLKDQRLTRSGTYAGESRAIAGVGGSGAVNFEYVANGATVFAPELASRSELIEAIGRGVGRVAIHEFLHQLLPKSPIHDSKDPTTFEGNSPALQEGYFGELHWGIAQPWLQRKLASRTQR